mgnify:FL=1|jgi:IS5 family transposase
MSQFGYKLHIFMDKDCQLIRRIETTTASVHDSRIDLSRKGETVYRDKGYFGVKPRASMDKTMHRAVRGHPLSIKENRRNKAISRTRSLVERPFAAMKRVFQAGHLMVTTVARIGSKTPPSASISISDNCSPPTTTCVTGTLEKPKTLKIRGLGKEMAHP